MAALSADEVDGLPRSAGDVVAAVAAGVREQIGALLPKGLTTTLVVDPALTGLLSLLVEFSFLQERGVVRVLRLSASAAAYDTQRVVYVVRADPVLAQAAAEAVAAHRKRAADSDTRFLMLWRPACTPECRAILEEQGVAGLLDEADLSAPLVPYDCDTLSYAQPRLFKQIFVADDMSPLGSVVQGICQLQRVVGRIPELHGKGAAAKRVLEMVVRVTRLHSLMPDRAPKTSSPAAADGTVSKLLIIDRRLDPLALTFTPLMYEGLLDEVVSIRDGSVDCPAADGGKEVESVRLHGGDELFASIRAVNYTALTNGHLTRLARDLQERIEDAKGGGDLRSVVDALPSLLAQKKSLALHVRLCALVNSLVGDGELRRRLAAEQELMDGSSEFDDTYLQELLMREPKPLLSRALRLLITQCIVSDGLKPKHYGQYRTEFLHTFGYDLIPLFDQLRKLGWLFAKGEEGIPRAWPRWQAAARDMQLNCGAVESDEEMKDPSDASSLTPHVGYAPVTVRLVQALLGISTRPGGVADAVAPAGWTRVTQCDSQLPPRRRQLVAVLFLGGMTPTEAAALRLLSQRSTFDFLMMATDVTNGDKLLRRLSQDEEKVPPVLARKSKR